VGVEGGQEGVVHVLNRQHARDLAHRAAVDLEEVAGDENRVSMTPIATATTLSSLSRSVVKAKAQQHNAAAAMIRMAMRAGRRAVGDRDEVGQRAQSGQDHGKQ